jgi:hypothetical protein
MQKLLYHFSKKLKRSLQELSSQDNSLIVSAASRELSRGERERERETEIKKKGKKTVKK